MSWNLWGLGTRREDHWDEPARFTCDDCGETLEWWGLTKLAELVAHERGWVLECDKSLRSVYRDFCPACASKHPGSHPWFTDAQRQDLLDRVRARDLRRAP